MAARGASSTSAARGVPRSIAATRPPKIRTRPGCRSSVIACIVVIVVWTLEERAQALGENDQRGTGQKPEPGVESEVAVDAEIRFMRHENIGGDAQREDGDEHAPRHAHA